jgi:hypothetical protein
MCLTSRIPVIRRTKEWNFDNLPDITTTLDAYSHVAPGLQQAAAMAFDDILKKDSSLDKQLAQILQN